MSVEDKIRTQIEFYFSDSNLPNDRFLKAEIAKDDGWVPLSTIASFQRLKQLSTDLAVVISALEPSTQILLNDDKTKIKRAVPLGDVDASANTVYIDGFPLDSTLESLEKFLTDNNVAFKCIRLRYHASKKAGAPRPFRGSILVELASPEAVTELVARTIASPQSVEQNLVIKSHEEFDMENKKREAERDAAKQKAEQDRMAEELRQQEYLERFRPTPFTAGFLIAFTGMPASTAREDISKACVAAGATVGFVDYDRGRPSGAVRIQTGDIEEVCKKLNESASTIDATSPPTFSVLTGDAEKVEWDVIERQKEERLMAAQAGDKNKRSKSRFSKFGNKKHFNKRQRQ